MNSQAPIIMSAAEAWPRRPPGSRTRPDRSPTLNGDASSSGGGDSALASPALGGSSLSSPSLGSASAFGPRLDLPGKSSASRESSEERERERTAPPPSAVVYKHEGTRLDKHKVARIAMAFGMAISAPAPAPPLPSSTAAHLQPPATAPLSASARHSRGTSAASSSSSSLSSFPPASPFAGRSSPFPPGPTTSSPHHLPPPSRPGGHLVSISAPPYLASSPVLLPLLPSLKAQLAAVAREFGLPSTVGLVLFLVYDDGGPACAGEGRVGEGVWEILWRNYFVAPPAALASSSAHGDDDDAPADLSHSSSTPRARVSSEPPAFAPPRSPYPRPTTSRHPSSSGTASSSRPVDPSESLLSRTPSTLTPASLRARKKLVRPTLANVLTPPLPSTSAGDDAVPSADEPTEELSSAATSVDASPTAPRVRHITHRVPSSPFPFPSSSPSISGPSTPSLRQPQSAPSPAHPPAGGSAISIVGTLEWDVDERGGAAWFDRWVARKGVGRQPRPKGGWQPASTAGASAAVGGLTAARAADSDSEDEPLPVDEGYARLSEDEDEGTMPSSEAGGERSTDGTSADDHLGLPTKGDDPLGDVFPSDEADFQALRSARDDFPSQLASPSADLRPSTPPAQERPREGSIGLGLGGVGFGLGFAPGEGVPDVPVRELGGLNLTGAALGDDRALEEGEDTLEGEQGVEEIEALLRAQRQSVSLPPAVFEPAPAASELTTPKEPQGETQLPPTPLKQRRKSSAATGAGSTSRDSLVPGWGPAAAAASAASGNNLSNPLNLTLEIASPPPSAHLPTLVTSPTSAFSPTGSDATGGGLAYLRGGAGGSMDSYASSGPSDGMLSAAIDGAFGFGSSSSAGKRGSALMMQDTLADLEKVVRSLSPRELKIPNRERSVAYSPGASSLSPAPSGSSFAVFPSPAFPPSAFVSPAGSPSIVTAGSSPLTGTGQAETGEGGSSPSRLQPHGSGLGKEDRDNAVRSIASSFMDQANASEDDNDKNQPLRIDTGDFARPVWPAVPVPPGSPLLSDVPLPVRKDSPMSSPRVPSPVPSKLDPRQRMSSASSLNSNGPSLGSPLAHSVGGGSSGQTAYPFSQPPPPAASPLQAAFAVDGDHDDDHERTERADSASSANSKNGSGSSRFRNFVWGRAASSGSAEEASLTSPPAAAVFSPLSPAAAQGAFSPSAAVPVVPRHQPIPESGGPPPSRLSATPSGRSVSDTSALEAVNQFGKFQLTPEMSSTGFQEMNFPSPPTGNADRKSSSTGKKRFRAPFNAGSLFGKNKKQLEISAAEIGEPVLLSSSSRSPTVPFHHRQPSDPSERATSPRAPPSPRKVSEGAPTGAARLPPSISQSFSARSISSTLNGTVLSPPGSPTSAMSPRSVKRKPVPGSAMQRSFSQDSSLSIVPSIPDVEPPLPVRTTSLGTPLLPAANSP